MKSWGPHPSSYSGKKLSLPLCLSSKQRRKRKFNVLFVQVVTKRALQVQNLLFFNYFILGSFRLTLSLPSPSPLSLLPGHDLSMCVNGKESKHVLSKNACPLFTCSRYHPSHALIVCLFRASCLFPAPH